MLVVDGALWACPPSPRCPIVVVPTRVESDDDGRTDGSGARGGGDAAAGVFSGQALGGRCTVLVLHGAFFFLLPVRDGGGQLLTKANRAPEVDISGRRKKSEDPTVEGVATMAANLDSSRVGSVPDVVRRRAPGESMRNNQGVIFWPRPPAGLLSRVSPRCTSGCNAVLWPAASAGAAGAGAGAAVHIAAGHMDPCPGQSSPPLGDLIAGPSFGGRQMPSLVGERVAPCPRPLLATRHVLAGHSSRWSHATRARCCENCTSGREEPLLTRRLWIVVRPGSLVLGPPVASRNAVPREPTSRNTGHKKEKELELGRGRDITQANPGTSAPRQDAFVRILAVVVAERLFPATREARSPG